MPDVQGDPRLVECPACFAPPGKPCNALTDDGRRDVTWFHLARAMEELYRISAARRPEHLRIETLQDFLEQKGER